MSQDDQSPRPLKNSHLKQPTTIGKHLAVPTSGYNQQLRDGDGDKIEEDTDFKDSALGDT